MLHNGDVLLDLDQARGPIGNVIQLHSELRTLQCQLLEMKCNVTSFRWRAASGGPLSQSSALGPKAVDADQAERFPLNPRKLTFMSRRPSYRYATGGLNLNPGWKSFAHVCRLLQLELIRAGLRQMKASSRARMGWVKSLCKGNQRSAVQSNGAFVSGDVRSLAHFENGNPGDPLELCNALKVKERSQSADGVVSRPIRAREELSGWSSTLLK